MTHAEFWELTPREVVLQIRAYGRRLIDELELGIASAWHGESFARSKRLPELQKVLSKKAQRGVDRTFTARETLRWARFFAEQKPGVTN